ncbi:MAG: hypothetical protein ABIW32_06175 [Terrimesophilobacter sp.]
MNTLDIILWSALLLVLVTGVLLALLASRQSTSHKPSTPWLITPVVGVIVAFITFVAAIGSEAMPPRGFLIVTTVLLVLIGTIGGSPLVLVALQLAGSGAEPLGDHGGILVTEEGATKEDREILRGGMTIGYLERLMIMGAALMGQFAAVAIVVAIKGLGRFSELENSAARERFIIGTLVSILWAALCVTPVLIGWQ